MTWLVPEVVVEVYLARWLPAAGNLEVVVQFEEAAGELSVRVSGHADDDLPLRDAVDGVRSREVVLADRLGLEDGRERRVAPVLGVEHVDASRAVARHDEVPSLEPVDVTRRRAGVPAEVVEFVAPRRHLDAVDHLAVRLRGGVDVDDADEVGGVDVAAGVQPDDVRDRLGRRLFDGGLRRRVARAGGSVVVVVWVRCHGGAPSEDTAEIDV